MRSAASSPSKDVSATAPATVARRVSRRPAPDAVRAARTWSSTRPVVPSTVTRGRTSASRAVDQCSSRTGRHMPAVTTVGPQSQPKEQAILRMYWKGSG